MSVSPSSGKRERPGESFLFEGRTLSNASFERLKIPTVDEKMTMDEYLKKEYSHATSLEGKRFRDQLVQIGKKYGNEIHEIKGDGNCLAAAFATSLCYIIMRNESFLKTFFTKLLGDLKLEKTQSSTRDLLNRITLNLSDLEVGIMDLKTFLEDSNRLKDFIMLIRNIANILVKKNSDLAFLVNDIASSEEGKEMEIECVSLLSTLFELKSHSLVLRSDQDEYQIVSNCENESPDIVIIRKNAHFLCIVPNQLKVPSDIFSKTSPGKAEVGPNTWNYNGKMSDAHALQMVIAESLKTTKSRNSLSCYKILIFTAPIFLAIASGTYYVNFLNNG